jgi:hypothetical protein
MARPITLTTEQWIERAVVVHGNEYLYTSAEYVGANKPITVICKSHGPFSLRASKHIEGVGCKPCSIERQRNTLADFLNTATSSHGSFYDYSLVIYRGLHQSVRIVCPSHGEFSQVAIKHMKGQGCKKCNRGEVWGLDDFIGKARSIHGDKYEYDNTIYEKTRKKIKISCVICGNNFEQTPNSHLSGSGCPFCGGTRKLSDVEFKQILTDAHDGEIAALGSYKNMGTKLRVVHTCGNEWLSTPLRLIHRRQGCPYCALDKKRMSDTDFRERLDEVHDGEIVALERYVHSKQRMKVRHLVCGRQWSAEPRQIIRAGCRHCAYQALKTTPLEFAEKLSLIHGDEIVILGAYKTVRDRVLLQHSCGHKWSAMPGDLVRRGTGCPQCASSKGNKRIFQLLTDAGVKFETEFRFETCRHRVALPFDFYIPALETLIEYDGEQHFKAIDFWGGEQGLKQRQQRDLIKNIWAASNGKRLYRIRYDEDIEIRLQQIMKTD